MNEWIKLIDSFPKHGETVLCAGREYGLEENPFFIRSAFYYKGYFWFDQESCGEDNYYSHITHWMPLPEPPKE